MVVGYIPLSYGSFVWVTTRWRGEVYSGWKTGLKWLAIVVCGAKSGVDSNG